MLFLFTATTKCQDCMLSCLVNFFLVGVNMEMPHWLEVPSFVMLCVILKLISKTDIFFKKKELREKERKGT